MSAETPATTIDYRCTVCRAERVKLWRKIHAADGSLFCRKHAEEYEAATIEYYARRGIPTGDTIGDLLPAVPVDDTFWGYTTTPQKWYDWWSNLDEC